MHCNNYCSSFVAFMVAKQPPYVSCVYFLGEKNLQDIHKLAAQGDSNGIMHFMKVKLV
jgi:hypothetical protein